MPQPILIEFQTDLTGVNAAIDAMEQMGMVDKATADQFRKTSTEAQKYAEEMKKLGKNVDTVKIDIGELVNEIKQVPKKIIEDSAKKSLDDMGRTTEDVTKKTMTLTAQLRAIKQRMSEMELQGKNTSKGYEALAKRAGELEDQIGDTAARVKILASDTRNLDAALSLASGVAGGFAVAQGAAALFGDENEDLQKALLKVNAALAIVNGLQSVQAMVNKDSAASVVLLGTAQKAWNAYLGTSTGLLRAFKIALVGTGLGAAAVAVIALVNAYKDWTERMHEANRESDALLEIQKESLSNYAEQSAELQGFIAMLKNENTTNKEKQTILQVVNEKYADQVGHFNSIEELENKFIERAQIAIKIMELKAKATAAQNLATKAYEESLQKQNESLATASTFGQKLRFVLSASTGDAKGMTDAIVDASQTAADASAQAVADFEVYSKLASEFNTEARELAESTASYTKKTADDVNAYVREVFTEQAPITPLPLPKELVAEVVEPSMRVIEDYYTRIEELRQLNRENAKEELDEIRQANLTAYQEIEGYAQASFDALQDINQQALNNRLTELDEQLSKGRITQEQYNKLAGDAKTKEAQREKTIAVFRSLLAIPEAFLEGLVQGGPPLAIFYASLAGIQSALIASSKVPQFAKGTKKAPAGMKWVGEEGPELINDGGGYAIIPHGESMAIAEAFDRWGVAYDTEGTAYVGGAAIDYDKLARALAKEISVLPISEMHFDKTGFNTFLKSGFNTTRFLDNRYSS